MIFIHRSYVSEVANSSVMFTDIDIDDDKKHVLVVVDRE